MADRRPLPPYIDSSWYHLNDRHPERSLTPSYPRLPPPERVRGGGIYRDQFREPPYPHGPREPRIFSGPGGAAPYRGFGVYPSSWGPGPRW